MSLEQKILKTLSRPGYRPMTPEMLARDLNLTKKKRREFQALITAMLEEGTLKQTPRGESN